MQAFKRFGGGSSYFVLLLASAIWQSAAQPVVYQATGTRDEIQPIIDQFKHDIVFGPGGDAQHPPSVLGSFRVATFDDVNATATTLTRGNLTSGGITLLGDFGPFPLVSANVTDASNPNRLFGDINPAHPAEFEAFSAPSILALDYAFYGNESVDLMMGDVHNLYLPRNAFGAVFIGVDSPDSAFFRGYQVDFDPLDPNRSVPLTYNVLPAGPGEFSFLGVILDSGRMAGLRLRMPNLMDSTQDAVAMDNLILGLAPPIPEPTPMCLLLGGGLVTWIIVRRQRGQARRRVGDG